MALKSSQNKYTSPNKNDESDTEEHQGETSQNAQCENKKKTKSVKKKSSKQRCSPRFPTIPTTLAGQSYGRVPTSLSVLPMIPTVIPVSSMAPYYPQYTSQLNYPIVNEWSAMSGVLQNPAYNIPFQPVPIVLTPPGIAPMCSYSLLPQPILAPVMPQPVIVEEIPLGNYSYDIIPNLSPEQTVPTAQIETVDNETTLYGTVDCTQNRDPMEMYLSLPRDLFPTARMLALDPNPIIDQFCKIIDIHNHAPWIMDLEFGVPRVPITRPIAKYDVKFNSVHCKNAPNAIHPNFERCSQDFKNVLLFYYDCVISSWYRGYVLTTCDESVENFQSWMLNPMQTFGMCWP